MKKFLLAMTFMFVATNVQAGKMNYADDVYRTLKLKSNVDALVLGETIEEIPQTYSWFSKALRAAGFKVNPKKNIEVLSKSIGKKGEPEFRSISAATYVEDNQHVLRIKTEGMSIREVEEFFGLETFKGKASKEGIVIDIPLRQTKDGKVDSILSRELGYKLSQIAQNMVKISSQERMDRLSTSAAKIRQQARSNTSR